MLAAFKSLRFVSCLVLSAAVLSTDPNEPSATPVSNSFTSAFANGFTMVGATELGDKVSLIFYQTLNRFIFI
jgi:hypothetical protein